MASFSREILSGQKYAPAKLGRVLILGLGKSGKAACSYCLNLLGGRVDSLYIAVGDVSKDAELYLKGLDISQVDVSVGTYEFDRSFDLCIASPGISQFSDFYVNAQTVSTEIISEVEFAWRESKESARWLAITGTNGKTTTTALSAHILRSSGLRASAVGNIGSTCLEAVALGNTDLYVAELSSYQLASTRYFSANVAILLNITPDHASWHTSHEEYVRAKLKIFDHLAENADSLAIIDAIGDECRSLVRGMKEQTHAMRGFDYLPLGTSEGLGGDMRQACGSKNAAYVRDKVLYVAFGADEHTLAHRDELRIRGEHNVTNVLAAGAAALALGCTSESIREAITSFEALEHRLEYCGLYGGLRFYNDSKATNIDATLKALTAFDNDKPILLLGGHDKGTDLSLLVDEAQQSAKAVVCYGAAGKRIFDAFEIQDLPHYLEAGLEAAYHHACEIAQPGDSILLSPACASFDEFDSFEHRGAFFKDLIRRRSLVHGE